MTEGMTMTVKARALAALEEAKEHYYQGQHGPYNLEQVYERASDKSGLPIMMLEWAEEDEIK